MSLNAWLSAPGSLTARLKAHGEVRVEVLSQGHRSFLAAERRDLGCAAGHVREVLLLLDGRPAVWARSCTPAPTRQGPWKAMRGLGSRPLAELLFVGHQVRRQAIRTEHLSAHSPMGTHMRRQWLAHCPELAWPRWSRSSVFWLHGRPLRVMEAFAPWVLALDAHRLFR